jgi:CARDB
MNSYYKNHNLPYTSSLGMMPHADDKNGVRTLYPSTQTVRNMMATCWAAPSSPTGAARFLKAKGTYMGGSRVTVPLTIENQGNITELGGSKGIQFAIYLSTNRIFSSYDTRLGSWYFRNNFNKHATWSGSVSATIPKTVRAGKYYLGVIIDDKNIIREQFENDNDAELGLITVNQLPDLICTNVTPTTSQVPRGSRFTAKVTVKNQGLGPSKACSGTMYLSYIKAWPFPGRDYTIGTTSLPGLQPGASATVTVPLTMPAGLCGERLYSLAFYADSSGTVKETNEANQVGYGQVTCKWPVTSKGQWLAGTVRGNIDSVGSHTAFPVCTKYTGILPSNSFYLWLWGISGTKPGIPVPGVGTLALNYDVVTQISLGFHNSYFRGMLGAQAWNARGSVGYIQGGMWLKPLWNMKTNLAVVWFVPGKKFLAVTQTPIDMFVRKPLQ